MHEDDQDSLFGSPPPSPQFLTASICHNESRLNTSTDTQNVGTIALPGSHYSELPLNPLALSLNHDTVHRPPAQSQDQPTTAGQNFQPWQLPTAQNKGSETSRTSQSPVPSRDPEFSFPDPSAPPPAHFLRNQQNLLGKAGLVAGVKPSSITHIRGTSFNPIVVDDEDTPLLGRKSRDARNHYPDPSVLPAPTNEDIVSVLVAQKDLFPVLNGILRIIGKKSTQPTSTTSSLPRSDLSNPPPVKRRKLHRVPAGAADWDVPYPFQQGDGPDEYHKTWERKRAKDLIVQLVKLIKLAARKAAIKNHLRKEKTRQGIWEELVKPEPQNQPSPPLPSHISFDSIISSLFTAQSTPDSSQTTTPGVGDSTFTNMIDNNPDSTGESFSASNTAAVPDDLDALISSMLNSFRPQDQGIGMTPVPSSSSSSSSNQPSLIGDDAIDPALLALSAMQPSFEENISSMSHAVSPVPSMGSSSGSGPMTPTSSTWDPDIFTGFSQGVFRPTLWNGFSRGAYQGSTEGRGWDEISQITASDFWSGMGEEWNMTTDETGKGKGKEVLRTNQSSTADTTIPIEENSLYNTLMGIQPTDIVLPPYEQQPKYPAPVLASAPPAPRPRITTISQSRKEEILRRAREKRKQVQEELDRVKTQLWETTVEQAALVHLLKRYDSENDQDGISIIN